MIRVKIVAEGKVQSVGYRDEVEDIAIDLGVKGFVRNLEEKDKVEIVCEADEKVVDKFLKNIKIKNELVDVKKLGVKKTKPTGEFKTFKIIREDKDSEVAERMDEAVKHLKGMKGEIKGVKREVKNSRVDIREVGQKVDTFTTQTNQHFTDLKGSYHTFSERMLSMEKKLTQLVEYIGMLVKNHIEKEEKERKTHAKGF